MLNIKQLKINYVMNETKVNQLREAGKDVSILAVCQTEIGTFEYLSNNTVTNNEGINVWNVPSLNEFVHVVTMCKSLYSDYGIQNVDFMSLQAEFNSRY